MGISRFSLCCTFFCFWHLAVSAVSPGDTLQQNNKRWFRFSQTIKKGNFIPIPILVYSPETRLGFGIVSQFLFRISAKDTTQSNHLSRTGFYALYTLRRQFIIQNQWDLFFKNNKYRLTGGFQYQFYPDFFYGLGNINQAVERERYESYLILLKQRVVRRWLSHFYAGLQYRLEYLYGVNRKEGGLFDTQNVEGRDGFLASGAGIILMWDNREHVLYPYHGTYITLSHHQYVPWLGSRQRHTNVNIDIRNYLHLGRGHIMAFQLYGHFNFGSENFRQISQFGGSEGLRGYFYGRYRDRMMTYWQTEYRFPLYRRFLGCLFTGSGDVFHPHKSWQFKDMKWSWGGGLRFTVDPKQRITLRFDYARGILGNQGWYFGISESF